MEAKNLQKTKEWEVEEENEEKRKCEWYKNAKECASNCEEWYNKRQYKHVNTFANSQSLLGACPVHTDYIWRGLAPTLYSLCTQIYRQYINTSTQRNKHVYRQTGDSTFMNLISVKLCFA